MAVRDYGDNMSRWIIEKSFGEWCVYKPHGDDPSAIYPTFTEAHAAYLDAVTCPAIYEMPNFSTRCHRARGHSGLHVGQNTGWYSTDLTIAV